MKHFFSSHSHLLLACLEELFFYGLVTLVLFAGAELLLPGFLVSPLQLFVVFVAMSALTAGILYIRNKTHLSFTSQKNTFFQVFLSPLLISGALVLSTILASLSFPWWVIAIQTLLLLGILWCIWK